MKDRAPQGFPEVDQAEHCENPVSTVPRTRHPCGHPEGSPHLLPYRPRENSEQQKAQSFLSC